MTTLDSMINLAVVVACNTSRVVVEAEARLVHSLLLFVLHAIAFMCNPHLASPLYLEQECSSSDNRPLGLPPARFLLWVRPALVVMMPCENQGIGRIASEPDDACFLDRR